MVTEVTETNSEDTGDSEGALSKAYARFKPLAGVYTHSAAARQDGEPETSGSAAERGRVFYGHDGYYVFFRLHQCLYERYETAQQIRNTWGTPCLLVSLQQAYMATCLSCIPASLVC